MSSQRLSKRAEWDGTFSLLLDGEVIVERKSKSEVDAVADYLGAFLKVRGLTPES